MRELTSQEIHSVQGGLLEFTAGVLVGVVGMSVMPTFCLARIADVFAWIGNLALHAAFSLRKSASP